MTKTVKEMRLSTPNQKISNLTKAKISPAIQLERATRQLAKHKAEIKSLRAEIARVNAQAEKLKNSQSFKRVLAFKDARIAALKGHVRTALRLGGLRASNTTLAIDPVGATTSPAEAYAAAIDAGDKKGAAEIFKAHKSELFNASK